MIPANYKYRVLRSFVGRPRAIRDLTQGHHLIAAPRHIEAFCAELLADGLIEAAGDRFIATATGEAALEEPTTTATVRQHSFGQAPWEPPKWEPSRKGADDHKRFLSHGIGA